MSLPSWVRRYWWVAIPPLLVGLYALLGFKVAPGIVRKQAIAFVAENYGRTLTIGEVTIHPFKLQATVRDLSLPDADGTPMLAFEQLFVDFELSSLWQRALVFKKIEIDAPVVRTVVRPGGEVNLADLQLPEEPGEEEEPPPSVWIHALVVERGNLQYVDNDRPQPWLETFAPLAFTLEDFRTTPEGGDFSLKARTARGADIAWRGRFALAPTIASEGQLTITGAKAYVLGEFLGESLPFLLTEGSIDLAGSYQARLAEELQLEAQLPEIKFVGLGIRARTADADWVTIPSISVADTRLSVANESVAIGKLTFAGLTAKAWLDPDGSMNLERLFDGGESSGAPEAAPATSAGPDAKPRAAPSATTPGAMTPSATTPSATTPSATTPAATSSKSSPAVTPTKSSSTAPAAPSDAADDGWSVDVASVEVADAAIDFEDRQAAPVKQFKLAPVNVTVKNASLDLARPLPITIDAVINDHAKFKASGSLVPDPLAADLDVELAKARMMILQPYVLPVADLTITGGELGMKGKFRMAPPESDGPELSFKGDVAIDRFASIDNAGREDFVNFDRLDLTKVDFALAPDALSIDRVTARRPYARVAISPEQVLNISAVLDPAGTAAALAERRAAEAAEAAQSPAEKRRIEKERKAAEKREAKAVKRGDGKAAATPPAAPPTEAAEEMPVHIRELRIADGRMNFSDQYVQPNFAADVQDIAGTVKGISSSSTSRAEVSLKGSVGEFSPVTIEGELQPFAFDQYTDMGLKFENISLPIFNPYSGQFAGYNIAKGKLTTDLHYRIEARRLDAQHKIRIDQLEWGEASATRGEATLPVKFATSLLKDRNGVINLDVPVGGTLDDPSFRIGPIVWQIIKNLISKIVTAPFAFLGSLFAGAEEAQFVDFAPGEATLETTTAGHLATLATGLAEKPEINLDVPLGTVAELDKPALEERAYEAAVAAEIGRQLKRKPDDSTPLPALADLEPARQIEVLTAIVRKQSGAEPQIPTPAPPPEGTSRADAKALEQTAALEYLRQTARAGVVVPDTELDRLAEERALVVERALLANGALEPTRVYKVREGKVTTHEGRVRFELGLK
jgi:uncharacterized protein involved in outer membrane biogenesis